MPASPSETPLSAAAARWLRGSGVLWFAVAATGQAAFIGFICLYYGPRILGGDFAAWNDKPLIDGYVEGDPLGNGVFAAHVLIAAVVTLTGLMQLVPAIRRRAPRLHRWTGRLFLTLAGITALTGVWLTVVRGTFLSEVSAAAILLNALLILLFGGLAWRNAAARRFEAHRRWAMRTFMVVSGVWFLRVGLMGWVLVNRGPVGMTADMSGPADVVLTFGSYLIPLLVLEVYLAAGRSRNAALKAAVALGLGLVTLFTALGVFGTVVLMWGPYLW